MSFENLPPTWKAKGAEPSTDLQNNGFVAGYKPPAEYFNYLFNRYSACINELQGIIAEMETTVAEIGSTITSQGGEISTIESSVSGLQTSVSSHTNNKNNPHGVTKSDVGLGNVPNVATNDQTPTFSVASTRDNIVSGEKLSTILGKVKKYFTDLKSHAFNDPVNNLTTSTTGSALDASQGKVLQGEVDEINSNLGNFGYERLSACSIDASGNIVEDATFDLFISSCQSGEVLNSPNSYVYGFFASKPQVGSKTYNGSRVVDSLENVTVPNGCSWVAIRVGKGVDTEIKHTDFYKNTNENIAELKNDLSNLKDGTTPAAKAVADEDGNNIKSTYATKTELDAKANIADPVFTGSFSQNREAGTTIGIYSHAEGERTTASGKASHAEGNETTASGIYSHAEGERTTASGPDSHAEGYNTTASDFYAHSEGSETTASGGFSHAEGYNTTALEVQHAGGHFNNISTATESTNNGTGTGTSFVIGNGTQNARSNAFRINDNGEVFAKSATISTGADYAEYFEWEDENPNNEDRRGYFVTINNKKIKLAKPNDYILGVISGFPSVIGNGDEEWMGRYVFDDFGAPVIEEFEYENPITGETKIGTKWKENPDYDNTRPYIQRSKRQEWDAVGMLGVLSVRDDGTCVPNKYCKITDGSIATLSEDKSDYRVLERVNDNVVKIVFR